MDGSVQAMWNLWISTGFDIVTIPLTIGDLQPSGYGALWMKKPRYRWLFWIVLKPWKSYGSENSPRASQGVKRFVSHKQIDLLASPGSNPPMEISDPVPSERRGERFTWIVLSDRGGRIDQKPTGSEPFCCACVSLIIFALGDVDRFCTHPASCHAFLQEVRLIWSTSTNHPRSLGLTISITACFQSTWQVQDVASQCGRCTLNADRHEPGAADFEASQKREFEHKVFWCFLMRFAGHSLCSARAWRGNQSIQRFLQHHHFIQHLHTYFTCIDLLCTHVFFKSTFLLWDKLEEFCGFFRGAWRDSEDVKMRSLDLWN